MTRIQVQFFPEGSFDLIDIDDHGSPKGIRFRAPSDAYTEIEKAYVLPAAHREAIREALARRESINVPLEVERR